MEDAAGEAEDGEVRQQPGAPEHVAGAGEVCPRRPPPEPETACKRRRAERQQPADLAADLTVEQAQESGGATEPVAASPSSAGWAALAEDAAEPVVAEDEVEYRVVGAASDVGPGRGGNEIGGTPQIDPGLIQ